MTHDTPPPPSPPPFIAAAPTPSPAHMTTPPLALPVGWAPRLRWMIRRDLPEILAIERASFAADAVWQEEDFLRALRHRNVCGIVAERDWTDPSPVVGYMALEVHGPKSAAPGVEIATLAVHPDYRRRGVGRLLLRRAMRVPMVWRPGDGSLAQDEVRPGVARATVSEMDLPVHRWLAACGWRAVAVERGWDVRDRTEAEGGGVVERDGYRFEWAPRVAGGVGEVDGEGE